MHLDRRFLNWGVFFIVLGGVPLAVQQGLLDRDLAARAWLLWPLLIIAAGVGLLLRRTDLTGSTVRQLAVEVNAGSARVQLPSGSLGGRLEANAGSLAICLPDGVGLRVSTNESITGSNNFTERGLTKSGDTYETANYGAATNRIELEVDVNAASVTLNPEDGCR